MAEYWNPGFDTMPWKEIQNYWLSQFPAFIEYIRNKSEFYKERLTNMESNRLNDFPRIQEIPLLRKEELRNLQEHGSRETPLGAIQAAKTEDIVQIISSSGTSGRPVYYGITRRDLESWQDALANFVFTAGIRRKDIVGHVVGTAMFAGGEPYFEGMRHVGATVVWCGGQSTSRIMDALRYLHCTAILGTVSFALHLGEHFQEVTGMEAKNLGVATVLGGGEPGLGEEHIRGKLREVWGAATVRETMGLSDVLPGMWAECEEESGMHFCAQKYVMVELLDPNDGKLLPWEPGVCGEAVYTTIARDATPVLRYRSNDYMQVEAVTCRCGRTSPKVRCIGRIDDMLIYKGMNVFPSAIRDVVISNFASYLTGCLQVVKDSPGQVVFESPIPLDVEVKSFDEVTPTLKQDIEEKIRDLLTVRAEVNLVAPNTLERTQYKTSLTRVRNSR